MHYQWKKNIATKNEACMVLVIASASSQPVAFPTLFVNNKDISVQLQQIPERSN